MEMTGLDAFSDISAISGGSFPVILHAFNKVHSTATLLDADGIVNPQDITDEALGYVPPNSMFRTFATSSQYAVEKALKAMGAINKTSPEDFDLVDFTDMPFWQAFVYFHFLEGAGIPPHRQMYTENGMDEEGESYVTPRDDVTSEPVLTYSMIGPKELYDDWVHTHQSRKVVERIKTEGSTFPDAMSKSPGAAGMKRLPDNLYVLDVIYEYGNQVPIPFIGTPDVVRSPYLQSTLTFDPVGNKTAEPMELPPSFLSTPSMTSEMTGPYSVEKFLAMSTNLMQHISHQTETQVSALAEGPLAPALVQTIRGALDVIKGPTLLDIPTTSSGMDRRDRRSMAFADGGYNDGNGILSLLHKGITNIVSVVALTPNNFKYDPSTIDDPAKKAVEYMSRYFGVLDPSKLDGAELDVAQKFMSHVFEPMMQDGSGDDPLERMYYILKRQFEEGNPMIVTLDDLITVANPFWGIYPDIRVQLTLVWVMGVPTKFSSQVPIDAAPPPPGRNFTEHGFFTNENLTLVPNVEHRRPLDPAALMALLPGVSSDNLTEGVLDKLTLEFGLEEKETRMTNFLGR